MKLERLALAMILLSATPTISRGQAASRPSWEVEVHVGRGIPNTSTGGTGSLPGPGAPFLTSSVLGLPSRSVTSWYFGDGTKLLNEVNEALRVKFPVTSIPRDIVALDPVLTSAVARWRSGALLGFRLSRVLSSRVAAELSLDYGLSQSALTPEALTGIEATRASFDPALNGLIRAVSTPLAVTSTSAIQRAGGHQILAHGTLNIDLKAEGRFIPYLAVGAGVVSHTGTAPSATLVGRYQLVLQPPVPVDEIDTVTLRAANHKALAGVIGFGARYFVSAGWGVRVDFRATLGPGTSLTLVDASPQLATATPPLGVCARLTVTSPSIGFGSPSCGLSSLSGPTITGFQTFRGSGVQSRVDVTSGLFMRF